MMNTKLMDECFRARMDELRNRFPLMKFRDEFVREFARQGIVYIQPKAVGVCSVYADRNCGLIFSQQEHIETALRLLRRWGFDVEEWHDRKNYKKWAYAVMLPEVYLRNKQSSDKLGERRTALRSLREIYKWNRLIGSRDNEITMKVNYCEEDGDRVRYNPTPRNIRYKMKSRQVSKESRTSNENRD